MSRLSGINNLKARYNFDKLSNWGSLEEKDFDDTMGDKVSTRGKRLTGYANPLERIREDKLHSMKRALYNSYQSAVIQFDKDDRGQNGQGLYFRCLINHDKLKVDYEDKILSIPFCQIPVDYEGSEDLDLKDRLVDTGTPGTFLDQAGNPVLDFFGQPITKYRVKPGDTFKWISGNEGYMPDSYWIIFLQYSEETAYFRGEIRKADAEIQIIPIEEDGSSGDPILYHGWTSGPDEKIAKWNVKKGVVWNNLYYTKLLYITKDENTQAFFKRFDRVVIDGQTWQVQGYNDQYGTSSKNVEGGMIRVALKETYTSTKQVLQEFEEERDSTAAVQIYGPEEVQTYDVVKYYSNGQTDLWSIDSNAPVKILSQSANQLKLEIKQVSSKDSFSIYYGEKELQITVKPFK